MSEKKIVFFDLDGTLTDNPSSEKLYLLWLLTHGYFGIKQIVQVIKFTCKYFFKFKKNIFVRNKVYLYGLPQKEVVTKSKLFAKEKLISRLRPRIVARVKQHQNNGDIVVLLTGAPKFIADVFADVLKITEVEATEFSAQDGFFSNLQAIQHPFAEDKVTVAQKVCAKYNFDLSQSVAYANSIHDLFLLEKAGQAIAVTPDHKLRNIALQKKWEIIY